MSDRKRMLKLASKVPPEQIAEVLAITADIPSGYFLVGDKPEHYVICCWHETGGLMASIIEDDVLALACEQHLLAIGAPVFQSPEEVAAYAESRGWPGRRADG